MQNKNEIQIFLFLDEANADKISFNRTRVWHYSQCYLAVEVEKRATAKIKSKQIVYDDRQFIYYSTKDWS